MASTSSRSSLKATRARKYFENINGTNDCRCIVEKQDKTLCNETVKAGQRYGGNLKQHLRRYHPKLLKSVELEEEELAKPKGLFDDSQPKLSEFLRTYDQSNQEYKAIMKSLALFFSGTNCPKSIVENPLFLNMVSTLNSQYKPPSRYVLTKEITQFRLELDQKLRATLSNVKRVTVVLDLWSKKDMTPFIGVTGHFFNRKEKRRYHVMLALKEVGLPHTGSAIYDKLSEVLDFWQIDKSKVVKMITNNTVNMISVFKNIDCNEDEDEDEDQPYMGPGDPNLDVTMDEYDIEQEINNFDQFQVEQQAFWSKKHLRCFIHSLQLVVNKFLKNQTSKIVLKSTDLIAAFSRSSAATQKLKESTNGKGLHRFCQTRWSSYYNAIDRMLDVQDQMIDVCHAMKIDCLLPSQWMLLAQLRDILEPFARFTQELQAYNSTTLSLVLPCLQELNCHIEKMAKVAGSFHSSLQGMSQDLQNRFRYLTEMELMDLDHTYVLATALDPRYKNGLSVEQLSKAKKCLLLELDHLKNATSEAAGIVALDLNYQSTGEPKCKRFSNWTSKQQPTVDETNQKTSIQREIEKYFDDSYELSEDSDPIEFWSSNADYPSISDFAIDFLTVPCSSSSAESLFSHAGFMSNGLRSKISNSNLENQVFVKTNYSIFN